MLLGSSGHFSRHNIKKTKDMRPWSQADMSSNPVFPVFPSYVMLDKITFPGPGFSLLNLIIYVCIRGCNGRWVNE